MNYASTEVLAAAVRAVAGSNAQPRGDEEPLSLLRGHAEHLLFTTATLAPPAACVDAALAGIAGEVGSLSGEDAVAELWTASLNRALQKFANAPEAWTGAATREFIRRAGITFGVEESCVLPLLRCFHARDRSFRFAIQVAVWRSPMFDYMKRVLAELPSDFDVDDPQESMRSLISALDRAD